MYVNVNDGPLFRDLGDDEEAEFEEYAAKNDPPEIEKWNIYHPVCRRVWLARGITPPLQKV